MKWLVLMNQDYISEEDAGFGSRSKIADSSRAVWFLFTSLCLAALQTGQPTDAVACRGDRRRDAHGRVSQGPFRIRSPWCLRCYSTGRSSYPQEVLSQAPPGTVFSLNPREKKPCKSVQLPGPISQISSDGGFHQPKGNQPVFAVQ